MRFFITKEPEATPWWAGRRTLGAGVGTTTTADRNAFRGNGYRRTATGTGSHTWSRNDDSATIVGFFTDRAENAMGFVAQR